ncbi:MAG: GDP-mannose 4,6-dehydratase [Candidatus Vogelbacteria bacterium]|nr:GDP-mannose 4,6-dehydratase [Candidatus Vogelbacteria bacterium]
MGILVTGSAGFIGFHVVKQLLEQGFSVVGIDSLSDYYEVKLKIDRNNILKGFSGYDFSQVDICDLEGLAQIFKHRKIDKICHLAAQPGVRYSIQNPFAYQKANNEGFLNVIECTRHYGVKQFVYASSSSVYGGNKKLPFSEIDTVDAPVSLYAATKKSNELVAHVYKHLYGINAIGLRFFTVYGPWGRPDMAYFAFTRAILADKPIKVYNHGNMKRDFTYVNDIVGGVLAALEYSGQCEIFNLGNDRTVSLEDFIAYLEKYLGRQAIKQMLPIQPGDIPETWADIDSAKKELGYQPKTDIKQGLELFVNWFKNDYMNLNAQLQGAKS